MWFIGRGQNINRSVEEVNSNPRGWLRLYGESTADEVETARELELNVESEDMTELLQSHEI